MLLCSIFLNLHHMKNFKVIIIIVSALSMLNLVGCSGRDKSKVESEPHPVKVWEVISLDTISKTFSGYVYPDQYGELAFKISGPLVRLDVSEGQMVKKGDLIAKIDDLDMKLQFNSKQATYQQAKSQMERSQRLLEREAVSVQDFESKMAAYYSALASFESAKDMLEQTSLRAPFDGFIQKLYVQNYQKVQAGQPIVALINEYNLLVKFTLAESAFIYLNQNPKFFIEFDNFKGIQFEADVKEYVRASLDGSGIPVTLNITDKHFNIKEFPVAVGFSCRVILKTQNRLFEGANLVPVAAVVSVKDYDLSTTTNNDTLNRDKSSRYTGKGVYVVKDGIAQFRPIDDAGLYGAQYVIVKYGVEAGEVVIAAGTTRITNGQSVRALN